jgi:hypothetical protein
LAGVVEDRKVEAEESASKLKQANDPRFVTSPTKLKKMERQAQETSLAAAQAEVALNQRREDQQVAAMAEWNVEKKAANDAVEAEQAERIKMANERDPRVRLEHQIKQAQRVAELLAQDRERAQETLRQAGIEESQPVEE